ncbi:RING finger protein 24-like [Ptychodera flava]|uniref:RING finger protein 24-like n=1 Tax=Ptychodera flava TaxID=63121 RepID=UPI00396A8DC6
MSDTKSSVAFTLEASLPILAVGGLATFLSLLFCCYLWRIRRQGDEERGYKKIRMTRKGQITNDICAVCLEEFSFGQECGLCPCGHGFHRKCIAKWLQEKTSCPMCNRLVKQTERTRLVTSGESSRAYRVEV